MAYEGDQSELDKCNESRFFMILHMADDGGRRWRFVNGIQKPSQWVAYYGISTA